ncbi:MAG TPA: TadA family conjugal transfer-associated ATPase [Pedococcus sp.]|jgi:pilus assembly protein CpaF|nr:TadA family conjugal transfer-associated ATPase [Pedococcus sp.]
MTHEVWVEERIRQGRPPDQALVAEVAAAQAATLGRGGVAAAAESLASEVLGLGPLESCLSDSRVTDILVNGDGAVWLDRGSGLERSVVELADAATARRLAVRLAGMAGRRLDEGQPWVDGLLPGGVRLHAVLPPLVEGGAHLSLRIPRVQAQGLAALRDAGMFGAWGEDLLGALMAARRSFVVTGGTGCGKTTVLAGMLAEVPVGERIVVVEDVRELSVGHPHVVRLQGRGANVEGQGRVTLVDLVRQALRMRPDRLVVGEVRGAEVREMLAALNTGHEGGCGTVHANTPKDVPARFEALGALAGLGREALQSQLASAVQAVVHVARRGRVRVVESISVLVPLPEGVGCVCAAELQTQTKGEGWGRLAALLGEQPC